MRMPLLACRLLAAALAEAEVAGTSGPGVIDPVAALERVPGVGGRRSQAAYTLPVSHRVAVERIGIELMDSRGLAASQVSRSRVVAAAIALFYEQVFGYEIREPEGPRTGSRKG